jgi:hypothetical protein
MRLWLPKEEVRHRNFERVRVAREVIEAAPENGRLGILPPGIYQYDYSVKCSTQKYWKGVAKSWNRKLEEEVSRLNLNGHDADDETTRTGDALNREGTEILTNNVARVQRSADNEMRFIERQAQTAAANKRWHVDVKKP